MGYLGWLGEFLLDYCFYYYRSYWRMSVLLSSFEYWRRSPQTPIKSKPEASYFESLCVRSSLNSYYGLLLRIYIYFLTNNALFVELILVTKRLTNNSPFPIPDTPSPPL